MSDEQDTMVTPGLEVLLEKVDSKFTLVSLAAKRSRQLNSYDLGLGEGGGSEVPPNEYSAKIVVNGVRGNSCRQDWLRTL